MVRIKFKILDRFNAVLLTLKSRQIYLILSEPPQFQTNNVVNNYVSVLLLQHLGNRNIIDFKTSNLIMIVL